jgi:hypothetical protein
MLYEPLEAEADGQQAFKLMAKSQLYLGLTGHKTERQRPYSFVRIDVTGEESPQFVVTPHISERSHQSWQDYALDPLVLS